MGAAALLPATLALISHAVPDPRKRGRYISLWATSLMLALALGPLLAGAILEHASWRWIYLPALPLALLTALIAIPLVTDSRGAGKAAPGLAGTDRRGPGHRRSGLRRHRGRRRSFTDPVVLLAFAVAALSLAAFLVIERRSDSPMLSPALFASRGFNATAVIAAVSFMGVIGSVFVLSLYLGLVQQLSTMEAALGC